MCQTLVAQEWCSECHSSAKETPQEAYSILHSIAHVDTVFCGAGISGLDLQIHVKSEL